MSRTNISWTRWKDADGNWRDGWTFNPWWGCLKVSPGCAKCYAEGQAKRFGHEIWGPPSTTPRRMFGPKHWDEPFAADFEAQQARGRARVFCASMADVFEDHPMVGEAREQLWKTIAATPFLDWQLLTKRPENIASMLSGHYWPNVWLMTSTENQEQADRRIPILLRHRDQVPVLGLSIEPQLDVVDLSPWLSEIDWAITGGESGPGHRYFDEDWARLTRGQCRAGGVAWHYKQFGGMHHADGGCLLDGEEIKEFPTPRVRALVSA